MTCKLRRGLFLVLLLGIMVSGKEAVRAQPAPLKDALGDPLPAGAFMRLGSQRLRQGGQVTAIAWSPDGQWVASGGHDHAVLLWDAATGKEIRRIKHRSDVRHVAISPDGTLGASVDRFGQLLLWETLTGKILRQSNMDDNAPVVFATNGKRFASINNEGLACLVETASGEEVRVFKSAGLQRPVVCLAWSRDGKLLATADTLNTINLFDTLGGKVRHSWKHPGKVECLSFAPEGKLLATAGQDKKVYLWDTASGQESSRLEGHQAIIRGLDWSPDGKLLATASEDRTARLWDAMMGMEVLKFPGHQALVACVAFAADGKRLASGGAGKDNSVRLWEAGTGKEIISFDNHSGVVAIVALVAGGKKFLTAATDEVVRLWDRDTGKLVGQFAVPHSRPKALAVTPDGKLLAAGGGDGSARLLELPSGKVLKQFVAPSSIYSVGISPDGKWLVSCGMNNKTLLWNVATEQSRELKHPLELVSAVAFSPDSKRLCTGANKGLLRLWDTGTGQELGRLSGHKGSLERIAFSPDGKLLGSISADSTARIWDANTGKEMRLLQKLNYGSAIAFSADGRMMATGGQDQLIRLWEVATGKQRAVLDGHRGLVAGLVFLPGGRTLLSGAADSTALCWDLAGRGKEAGRTLDGQEFETEWKALQGADTARAYQAFWTLAADPKATLARLQKQLQPVKPVDAKDIAQSIVDLESGTFDVRTKAMTKLQEAGDLAWPALRNVLDQRPSLELQTRIRKLLGKQDDLLPFPERLQLIRSLELLEQLDTPEADAFVQTLAMGVAEAWLTQQAQAMVQRRKER
jgi:WD40 repeat protein